MPRIVRSACWAGCAPRGPHRRTAIPRSDPIRACRPPFALEAATESYSAQPVSSREVQQPATVLWSGFLIRFERGDHGSAGHEGSGVAFCRVHRTSERVDRTCRSAWAACGVLHRAAAAWGEEEHRADGGAPRARCDRRQASVVAPLRREGAVGRGGTARLRARVRAAEGGKAGSHPRLDHR